MAKGNNQTNKTTAMTEDEIREIALELEPFMNKVREISDKYNLSKEVIAIYLWRGEGLDVECDGFKGWGITQKKSGELAIKFNYVAQLKKGEQEDE